MQEWIGQREESEAAAETAGAEPVSRQSGRNYLLLSLFVVLLADQIFHIGLSLAPGLSFKNLYLYIVVVYLLSKAVINGEFFSGRFPSFFIVFGIFCGYEILSWLFSSIVLPHYESLVHLVFLKGLLTDPYLFFTVFFFGCRRKEDALWLTNVIAVALSIVFVLLLMDYMKMPDMHILVDRRDGRIGGAVGNANEFAAFLVFFLLVMSPRAALRGRSWIVIVGILAGFALLLLTGSRGAIVGLVASAFFSTFLLRRHLSIAKVTKVGAAALVAVTCVVMVVVSLYPDVILERLNRTESGSLMDASSGRTEIWSRTLDKMEENPITFAIGYGWDSFREARIFTDPHNEYLYMLFVSGGVGLALYLAMLVSLTRTVMAGLVTDDPAVRSRLMLFVYAFVAVAFSAFFGVYYVNWYYIFAYSGVIARLAWLAQDSAEPKPEPEPKPESESESAVLAHSARAVESAATYRPAIGRRPG